MQNGAYRPSINKGKFKASEPMRRCHHVAKREPISDKMKQCLMLTDAAICAKHFAKLV